MKCTQCNCKIASGQLWIVDQKIYCSPRCERRSWDERARKWSTAKHRFGDKQVNYKGVAGFVNE